MAASSTAAARDGAAGFVRGSGALGRGGGFALLEEAVTERPELLSGLNTVQGAVCHPGVARALGVAPRPPMACLR